MWAQFPLFDKLFILRSQIYISVSDRTQVDREIESPRRSKVLRVFKLNTGQDDHAIMLLDDYLKQIDRFVERMDDKKMPKLEVSQWFKLHVLNMRLHSLLSLRGRAKDKHISFLINGGVLMRQLIDPNMYWFAIPNVGSLLEGLNQGKNELLSLLSRRKRDVAGSSREKEASSVSFGHEITSL